MRERAEQTELPASRLVDWIGIGASKFFDWKQQFPLKENAGLTESK